MKTKSLVIELAGLPGAGKTTLVEQALSALNNQGYKCYGRAYIFNFGIKGKPFFNKLCISGQFLFFCLCNYRIIYHLFCFTLGLKPIHKERMRFAFRLLVLIFLIKRAIKKINKNSMLVLDQGIIQNLWSIMILGNYKIKKYHITKLLQLISKKIPFKVIFLQIDSLRALDRIKLRDSRESRFDRMQTTEVSNLLTKSSELLEDVIHIYEQISLDTSIRLDTEKNINENTQRLAQEIINQYNSQTVNLFTEV